MDDKTNNPYYKAGSIAGVVLVLCGCIAISMLTIKLGMLLFH